MSDLAVAPLLVALVTAIVTLGVRFVPRVQRVLSVAGTLAYAVAVALLSRRVLDEGAIAYQLSGWQAPYGITVVADALAAFMLAMAAIVAVAAIVYSVVYMDEFAQRVSYHPLFHFMLVGVSGAFLTGDIFNLFVWFEVMLMPSYVLVVFYSGPDDTSASLRYTALNLVGSAVMLVAIGGLYATTGTLNMADMAQRLATAGTQGAAIADPAPVLGLAGLLLAVFALKAGLVPFQFWVPSAYRAAPTPATAMLAGVTKKVGVYAIIRLFFTVFAAGTVPAGLGFPGVAGDTFLGFVGPVLFLMAAGSILVGGLGAVSRPDLDGVFAYSSISQVGFIVLPLAVAATMLDPANVAAAGVAHLGVVAALIYSLNHAVAKALLFFVSGSIRSGVGSDRLADLGGLVGTQPVLSGSFFLGALAMIGIPPLTGFFGKLFVFDTAGRAGVAGAGTGWLALAVALAGAVLTIAYLSRVWSRGFWGDASQLVANATQPRGGLVVMGALAVLLVVLGLGFDPVLRFARAGATAAVDRQAYVSTVLGEVAA